MSIQYDDGIVDYDDRVMINGGVCNGQLGTVVGFEDDGINIRLDNITEEMKGYDDARTGVIFVNDPKAITKL